MGTIPAPNIADEAGQIAAAPVNAYAEYARAAQLKQQTQLAAAQTQGAQQENQIRQRQMQDADALTKAMTVYDPAKHTPDDIPRLLGEAGGSGQAQLAAQKSVIEKKTALATLDKDQLTNLSAHHDAALGAIDAARQVPTEQLTQHMLDTAKQLQAQGHLTPQEAQQLTQHAQSMPAEQFAPWLDIYEKGLKGEKQQIAELKEKKTQEVEQQKADAGDWKETGQGQLTNTKTKETIGTARQPVELRELQDYLSDPTIDKQIAHKNAATFAAWKAKQSPNAVILGNQLGAGGQGSALDQAAQRYSQTGDLPAGFARSPGTTAAIIKRAAEMNPDANIAYNKATFAADSNALKKVQGQFDQVTAFEGTALKNLDLFITKAKAIPDLGMRFANVPLRMITDKMIGEKNFAAMNAARQTAFTEAAKVLNSATASGVLSDSARKELNDVMSGNLPLAASIEVVNTLKQDMGNRHQSYQDDIDAIKGRLSHQPKPAGGGSLTFKAPNNKTYVFKDQASLDEFKKAAGIQ
jgi:hypothetical protein